MAKAKKTTRRKLPARKASLAPALPPNRLLGDIRSLIESAREQTARAVNSGLVELYWHIGKRIREDVLGNDRADYGRQILQTLSKKLTEEYRRGFSQANLSWMMRFADVFPDERIVATLSRQLGWSHFVELIPLDGRPRHLKSPASDAQD